MSSASKILIIDFEDSFTYNILGQFDELGYKSEVIHYKKYLETFERNFFYPKNIVLGPGPGHPEEYQLFSATFLQKTLFDPSYNFLGICLGHQLVLSFLGIKVEHAHPPIHGEQVEVSLSEYWQKQLNLKQSKIKVQRYNSLAAKNSPHALNQLIEQGFNVWSEQGEILGLYQDKIITYQFHPESIGTNCSHNFFQPFLRNIL